jgi:hypothetical protein
LENDLGLLAYKQEDHDSLHGIVPIEALENAKDSTVELLGQAIATAMMPLCRSSTY